MDNQLSPKAFKNPFQSLRIIAAAIATTFVVVYFNSPKTPLEGAVPSEIHQPLKSDSKEISDVQADIQKSLQSDVGGGNVQYNDVKSQISHETLPEVDLDSIDNTDDLIVKISFISPSIALIVNDAMLLNGNSWSVLDIKNYIRKDERYTIHMVVKFVCESCYQAISSYEKQSINRLMSANEIKAFVKSQEFELLRNHVIAEGDVTMTRKSDEEGYRKLIAGWPPE